MRLTSQEQMILTYMEQFYKEPHNSQKLFKLLNGRTSIRLIDYFTTNYSKKYRSNIMLTTNKKIQPKESKYDDKQTDINDISILQNKKNIVDHLATQDIDDHLATKDIDNHQKSKKSQKSQRSNISQTLNDDESIDEITSNDLKIKNNKNYQIFNIHSSYKSQLKAWNKKYFDPFSRGDRIVFFLNDVCIITTIGQLNFFKWFINNKIYRYIKEHYNDIEQNMNSNKQSTRKTKNPSNNKSYYKKNQIKNSYLSSQNNIRKIDNITLNAPQSKGSSFSNKNTFKKSTKIEVRFD